MLFVGFSFDHGMVENVFCFTDGIGPRNSAIFAPVMWSRNLDLMAWRTFLGQFRKTRTGMPFTNSGGYRMQGLGAYRSARRSQGYARGLGSICVHIKGPLADYDVRGIMQGPTRTGTSIPKEQTPPHKLLLGDRKIDAVTLSPNYVKHLDPKRWIRGIVVRSRAPL